MAILSIALTIAGAALAYALLLADAMSSGPRLGLAAAMVASILPLVTTILAALHLRRSQGRRIYRPYVWAIPVVLTNIGVLAAVASGFLVR